MKYRTILVDPPWNIECSGTWQRRNKRPSKLPYQTMSLNEIEKLPVSELALDGAHLWLWTTNQFLHAGFHIMEAWGFKFLAPIHMIKPSGFGNYFQHRTQTVLFGYRNKCKFQGARYLPNIINVGNPREHSAKPEETYKYIESISQEPRIELFARPWTPLFQKREGWDVWGNEVESDVEFAQRTN